MLTLNEKIQERFIGTNWDGESETIRIFKEEFNLTARMYDQCIDDGADGDETEDEYVMKACFDFKEIDGEVRIYYGDVTEEIGYVDAGLDEDEE